MRQVMYGHLHGTFFIAYMGLVLYEYRNKTPNSSAQQVSSEHVLTVECTSGSMFNQNRAILNFTKRIENIINVYDF